MEVERFNPMIYAKIVERAYQLVYKPKVGFYEYSEEKGLWVQVDRDYVDEYAIRILNGKATPSKMRSITTLVQKKNLLPQGREFNKRKDLINLQNGMYDISNRKLIPHNPEYYSTNQLNVNYNPRAGYVSWFVFLCQIFDNDRECIDLIQEFMGYSLVADTRFEKALLLFGEGANGKSTLIKVWEALVGSENVASVTLGNLENQFHRVTLHNKLLNIAAEIDSTTVEQSDYFKRIVSGDTIDAAHKNKPVFQFKPYARLVFAMNELPRIKDNSYGFYRRLMLVPFNKRFEGKAADKELSTKLIGELDGIFLWALKGLYRLYKNDGFTEPKVSKEMLSEYRLHNNPVQAFVDECCVVEPEAAIKKEEIYRSYKSYAKEYGYEIRSANTFFKDLYRAFPAELSKARIGPKGAREYVVKGIRLKDLPGPASLV